MALEKQVMSEYGVNANYWRILRINENFDGDVEVIVIGYSSQIARLAGKKPLTTLYYTLPGRDLTRASVYTLLKQSMPVNNTSGQEVETNILVGAIDA